MLRKSCSHKLVVNVVFVWVEYAMTVHYSDNNYTADIEYWYNEQGY